LYYLSVNKGIPVRVESLGYTDRPEAGILWSWQADVIERVGDHHVATKSHMTSFAPASEGQSQKTRFVLDSVVESVEYNKIEATRPFRPTVQPGVRVNDLTRHGSYVTPDTTPSAWTGRNVTAAPPPAATLPRDLSGGISLGAIVFGVVLLCWAVRRRS
jgi:hypothetical protein